MESIFDPHKSNKENKKTCLHSCKCHSIGVSPGVSICRKTKIKDKLISILDELSLLIIQLQLVEYPATWPFVCHCLQSSTME